MSLQDKFNKLHQERAPAEESSLEHKVVKQLLKAVDPSQQQESKYEKYSLDWLYQSYGLPLKIKVEKIAWLHEADWGDLFTRFNKTKIVEAFDLWHEECFQAGRSKCGVVSPWPRRGLLVIHNWKHEPINGFTQIVRPHKNSYMIFEELDALITAMK